MPKFPGLSGADLVAALEKLGVSKVRQSGSHISMRRDSASLPELCKSYWARSCAESFDTKREAQN